MRCLGEKRIVVGGGQVLGLLEQRHRYGDLQYSLFFRQFCVHVIYDCSLRAAGALLISAANGDE
jgi:hypothetical protein